MTDPDYYGGCGAFSYATDANLALLVPGITDRVDPERCDLHVSIDSVVAPRVDGQTRIVLHGCPVPGDPVLMRWNVWHYCAGFEDEVAVMGCFSSSWVLTWWCVALAGGGG